MLPADEVVEDLTRLVFETVVGRTATRDESQPNSPRAYTVEVLGAWTGSISVEASDELARLVTRSMFDCLDAPPDDVRDAMCELANVIGGNLKGLMPGPSALSVPRVTAGESAPSDAKQLLFSCAGEPFSVTVRAIQPENSQL